MSEIQNSHSKIKFLSVFIKSSKQTTHFVSCQMDEKRSDLLLGFSLPVSDDVKPNSMDQFRYRWELRPRFSSWSKYPLFRRKTNKNKRGKNYNKLITRLHTITKEFYDDTWISISGMLNRKINSKQGFCFCCFFNSTTTTMKLHYF